MNHNEVKAYFKKQLKDILPEKYDVLSIDHSVQQRALYVFSKSSLAVILKIDTYFHSDYWHLQAYQINAQQRQGNEKLNIYKPYMEAKGNYLQLHEIRTFLMELQKDLLASSHSYKFHNGRIYPPGYVDDLLAKLTEEKDELKPAGTIKPVSNKLQALEELIDIASKVPKDELLKRFLNRKEK